MPNRIIREAILTSERVASLGWPEEVFYRRLHSIVDDYGRHEAGHQLLRAKCYPLQTDSVRVADIARWMAACQKSGVILVYGVNGKQYLEVCDFGQQQRSASKCPAPPAPEGALLAIDSKCQQVAANEHLDVSVSVSVSETPSPANADVLAGVAPQVAADFRKLRQAKKAAITQTAIDGIKREAAKAGLSLEAALTMCCERGWTGFKADWVAGVGASPMASLPGGGRRAL
jgi:hypothetical protein